VGKFRVKLNKTAVTSDCRSVMH